MTFILFIVAELRELTAKFQTIINTNNCEQEQLLGELSSVRLRLQVRA